jgi:hypothetical protein
LLSRIIQPKLRELREKMSIFHFLLIINVLHLRELRDCFWFLRETAGFLRFPVFRSASGYFRLFPVKIDVAVQRLYGCISGLLPLVAALRQELR